MCFYAYVLRYDVICWHKKYYVLTSIFVCKCTYVPIVTVHMNCYQIWWRRRKCPTFMPLLLRSHVLSLVTWRSKLFFNLVHVLPDFFFCVDFEWKLLYQGDEIIIFIVTWLSRPNLTSFVSLPEYVIMQLTSPHRVVMLYFPRVNNDHHPELSGWFFFWLGYDMMWHWASKIVQRIISVIVNIMISHLWWVGCDALMMIS